MNTVRLASVTLATLTLVLSACAAQQGGGQQSTELTLDSERPSISAPPIDTVPSDDEEAMTGEVPEDLLADILAEAASRAGVDPSAVEVIVAEEVTWSDGSLGCPEAGMSYTQALVPGYRVVVEVDGEELNFHASQSGGFQLCDDPQPPAASDR
ncbi:hypothetical protein BH23CHL10_BH23CHL10_09730 [soil metagenome]